MLGYKAIMTLYESINGNFKNVNDEPYVFPELVMKTNLKFYM